MRLIAIGLPDSEFAGEGATVEDWSPLEEDVLLKGTLTVIVNGHDGRPRAGQQVLISGCGFV